MKPKDRYGYGQYTYRWKNKTLISTNLYYANRSIVECSTLMNKGDFKTPTNHSYTIRDCTFWDGEHRWYQNPPFDEIDGLQQLIGPSPYETNSFPALPVWDRSNVYNACLERLNSKVRGDLDLGVSLAEIGSTARMVKSITKVVDFAKSKRWSTKDLANGWLQWTYGWKPLASDIYNVAQESIRVVQREISSVKAAVRRPLSGQSGVVRLSTVNGVSNVYVNRQVEGAEACTIGLRYLERDRDLARWTSLNPVSLGWELIPYSFVIDWFVDVGSYLRNVETALLYGSSFVSGYKSELFAADITEEVDPTKVYNSTGTYGNRFAGYTRRYRYRQFLRSKLTSHPLPHRPSFKADLSSNRLLSAAALLRQFLR